MAAFASITFTVLLCACFHTVVECDSACSNMLECTIYTIQEVGRKVDNMHTNMASIVNQLTQIQVNHNQQELLLSELQSQFNNQTEINNNQSAINNHQSKVIAEQGEMIEVLQLENQEQAKFIVELAKAIAEQYERISDIEIGNQQQQSSYEAFTVSATEIREYNEGDRVVFDAVLNNYRESYDPETSTFTCSHAAYYLFSLTVVPPLGQQMYGLIHLDETPLVTAYGKDYNTGTNLVVTFCGAGQRVWVKCLFGQGQFMQAYISVFSGTLLRLV